MTLKLFLGCEPVTFLVRWVCLTSNTAPMIDVSHKGILISIRFKGDCLGFTFVSMNI